MRPLRVLLLVSGALILTLDTAPARARCVDYWDIGSVPCSGPGGCQSEWEDVTCWFGCISGTCNDDGNSTECCGVRHDYAQVYGDGGNCDNECGDSPVRVHATASNTNPLHRAELLQGYSPGLIMLDAHTSYKPTQLIYVLNRCNHTYELMVLDGRVVPSGGL